MVRLALSAVLTLISLGSSPAAQASQVGRQQIQTPDPVSGRDRNSPESLLPADVLSRTLLFGRELELIRRVMGRPKDHRPLLLVRNARPQEVYFQALTLHLKADRLAFEQTRILDTNPLFPRAVVRSIHVFQVVDLALMRILEVKAFLGLKEHVEEPLSDVSTTPTEVFSAIVNVSRQANLVLSRKFTASDVFEQVTRAVHSANALLAGFGIHSQDLGTPEFEPYKEPIDVYGRLLGCYDLLRSIAKSSGVKMIELSQARGRLDHVLPSDVYDIASLVVSELAYLRSQVPSIS